MEVGKWLSWAKPLGYLPDQAKPGQARNDNDFVLCTDEQMLLSLDPHNAILFLL